MQQNRILLHACCAICSAYPIEFLRKIGYEPIVYFCNPNIYPYEEFEKRLNELVRYTKKKEIELIIDKQETSDWYNFIAGYENEPERGKRCSKCFEYRLLSSARKTIELGFYKFTTTLTISPHKNSKIIFEIGKEIARKYNLEFLEFDFKKKDGFLKTTKISREENFYKQNYCGCEFSINNKKSINL